MFTLLEPQGTEVQSRAGDAKQNATDYYQILPHIIKYYQISSNMPNIVEVQQLH